MLCLHWAYIQTQPRIHLPPSGLQPQATRMKPLAFPLVCLRDIISTEHEHYALPQMEGIPFNCVREAVSPHGLSHLAQHPHHLLEEGLMRAVPAASLNAIDSHCSCLKFSRLLYDFDDLIIFFNFVQLFVERICWSHLAIARSLDLHILDFYTFFFLLYAFNPTYFLLRTA